MYTIQGECLARGLCVSIQFLYFCISRQGEREVLSRHKLVILEAEAAEEYYDDRQFSFTFSTEQSWMCIIGRERSSKENRTSFARPFEKFAQAETHQTRRRIRRRLLVKWNDVISKDETDIMNTTHTPFTPFSLSLSLYPFLRFVLAFSLCYSIHPWSLSLFSAYLPIYTRYFLWGISSSVISITRGLNSY